MNDRAEYITGLRMLADLLERHDDLPLPYQGRETPLTFYFLNATREAFAAAARILPGPLIKHTPAYDDVFQLTGSLAGLRFQAVAYRATVCERVVTGVETVVREVPDPAVEVPLVSVTEEVETIEWRCSPLLSDVDAPAVTG